MAENGKAVWTRPIQSPEDLGDWLRRLRVERDLTQEELADQLGISRRYVYEIESAKPSLHSARVFAILNLLGTKLTAEAEVSHDST